MIIFLRNKEILKRATVLHSDGNPFYDMQITIMETKAGKNNPFNHFNEIQ